MNPNNPNKRLYIRPHHVHDPLTTPSRPQVGVELHASTDPLTHCDPSGPPPIFIPSDVARVAPRVRRLPVAEYARGKTLSLLAQTQILSPSPGPGLARRDPPAHPAAAARLLPRARQSLRKANRCLGGELRAAWVELQVSILILQSQIRGRGLRFGHPREPTRRFGV
jgi:hypothetical protein